MFIQRTRLSRDGIEPPTHKQTKRWLTQPTKISTIEIGGLAFAHVAREPLEDMSEMCTSMVLMVLIIEELPVVNILEVFYDRYFTKDARNKKKTSQKEETTKWVNDCSNYDY